MAAHGRTGWAFGISKREQAHEQTWIELKVFLEHKIELCCFEYFISLEK